MEYHAEVSLRKGDVEIDRVCYGGHFIVTIFTEKLRS